MINNIRKKIGFTSSTFLIVFGVLLYFLSVWWVSKSVANIETVYKEVASKFATDEKIAEIRSIEIEHKRELLALDNFFIKKGNEVYFIGEIERIAREVSVDISISSIQPDTKEKSGYKENLNVSLNIMGDWSAVMTFLDRLNKLNFGVGQDEISLDYRDGVWSGDIKVIVYREK